MAKKKTDFQKLIKELQNENLTVKRQKEILSLIHERVFEIWSFICSSAGASLDWYSFSNDKYAYSDGGDGSDGGFFDVDIYEEFIDMIGEWHGGDLYRFEEGFPTSLLYSDDYKSEVLQALKEDKMADKERRKHILKRETADAKTYNAKKDILNKLSKLSLSKLQQILKDSNVNKSIQK